jgi:hypothetical protein
MYKRVQLVVVLLLMLTIAACGKKSTNTSENQPSNNANQQAAANPPPPAAPALEPRSAAPPPQAKVTPPPPPKPVVLPAGTTLTVQVDQAISTKSATQGDVFTAWLASPVSEDGKVVIPRKAHVEGVVVQSKSPGKFKGEGTLSVKLTSLTVNNSTYRIDTAPNTQTAKGKGKRTAVMAGGGTGAGALIGGLAGGGKGALIGGLAGAGAGTAGAALTGNKDLAIPAESTLSFRLQQPLTLKPHAQTETRESASSE